MAKKLYVGGLPYATTEQELRGLFEKYGAVISANIITDKFSGRSKGFGFVEMEEDGPAETAISNLNGSDFGGRSLVVNEARPPQPRENRFGGGGGGGFDRGGRGRPGGGGGGGRDRNRGGNGGGGNRW